MLLSRLQLNYFAAAAPPKKSKSARSGRGCSALVPRQSEKSIAYLATSQARPEPVADRGTERKPAVKITEHACRVRASGAVETASSGIDDVVFFGEMAKLWDSVPWFESDARDFDPAILFDGIP